jgi:outer membrane protein OmpA-like peptidoglycan-associated protein
MTWYSWGFGWWLAGALSSGARAQVPVGDGLQGAYYEGRNFERHVSTRRDARLDFDWRAHHPIAGVATEQFSVRWTGWLVPPTTGYYVLCLSVDDGIRLWLGERQLLDDWRSHGQSYYQVAITLHAGEAYLLRLDYCQADSAARVELAWKLPATPAGPGQEDSRGGSPADKREAVVIPTRYLFSFPPHLPPVPRPAATTPTSPPPGPTEQSAASTSLLVVQPSAGTIPKPRPRSYLPVGASRPLIPSAPAPADLDRIAAAAARLATGKSMTLQTLYFEQGQASLLPAVQASLDTLAQALASLPALRLEVQGHTDNQGNAAINQRLSQQRAAAVCAYLATRGVAASRLRAVGYGGSRPVADNNQLSERPANRRVVLKPLGR